MMLENICKNCFSQNTGFPCSKCGYRGQAHQEKDILPVGTILNAKYLIGQTLGRGGFGITYLALDLDLQAKVCIKEYFPDDISTRTIGDSSIHPYSGDNRRSYEYGKKKFIEEGRALAQFNYMGITPTIHHFFSQNNTHYIVMEYLDGQTLLQYLNSCPQSKLSLEETKKLILPVMDSLSAVHKANLIHRDIAPDNIFITKDGGIKLIDFGAARYDFKSLSKSTGIMLKRGYAPPEQYASGNSQGPWTDVYALSATIVKMLTGHTPAESSGRFMDDKPFQSMLKQLPKGIQSTIAKGMALRPSERIQTIDELKKSLLNETKKKTTSSMGLVQRKNLQIAAILCSAILLTAGFIYGLSYYKNNNNQDSLSESYWNDVSVTCINDELDFFVETDYIKGELYVNDKFSCENTGNYAPEKIHFDLDEQYNNSINDIEIHLIDEDGEIVRKIVIDDFYYCNTGNLNQIESNSHLKYIVLNGVANGNINGDIDAFKKQKKLRQLYILSAENITGDIGSLKNLKKLEKLVVNECENITGDISALENLNNLIKIQIINNQKLTGNIEVLGQFPQLETLSLWECSSLNGSIGVCKDFENLKILELCDNYNLTGNISTLENLTKLKRLTIWECPNITGDIKVCSNFKDLETFEISHNDSIAGDISALTNLTSLEKLSFSSCGSIEGDIEALEKLTNLKYISLWNCENLEGDLSAFKNMTMLKRLDINSNDNIKGNINSLKSLYYLETLYLNNCCLIEGSIASLEKLNNLESLTLMQCEKLTGTIGVCSNFNELTTLKLYANDNFTGNVSTLKDLSQLKTLFLLQCKNITGSLGAFKNFDNLKILQLSANKNFTGNINLLTSIKGLETLYLKSCSAITGNINSLENLTNLKRLTLWQCKNLSGDVKAISTLDSLNILEISYNDNLMGDISSFADLFNLETLTLLKCSQLSGDINSLTQLKALNNLSIDECEKISGDIGELSSLGNLSSVNIQNCPEITGSLTLKNGTKITLN